MKIYGFEIHRDNKSATLTLMTDVGQGNGALGGRWQLEDIKTGPKQAIMNECQRLNEEVARERNSLAAVAN